MSAKRQGTRPTKKTNVGKLPTTSWWSLVATVFALLLTICSGYLYGVMAQQWGLEEQYRRAAEVLDALPTEYGAWQLEQEEELGQSAMELLQCQGFINQTYRNRDSGETVRVAVMVGPGAKMSIHVPEICFEAANFRLLGDRQRLEIDQRDRVDAFWSVRFQLNDITGRELDVLYGWYAGGTWQAPRFPRWSVASTPVLFKLQLACPTQAGIQVNDAAGCQFLRSFLPVLNERLAVLAE